MQIPIRAVLERGGLISLLIVFLLLAGSSPLHAIGGLEGTFEYGLDAPWRLEPYKKADGSVEYGAIPIQITIHDANRAHLDNILYATDVRNGVPVPVSLSLPRNLLSLGKFYSVRVQELGPVEMPMVEFPLSSLFEIETTQAPWPWPYVAGRSSREHQLCRVWKGDNPEPFRDISDTSEWHATLWFVPATRTPGTSVSLQIEVLVERYEWPAIKMPYSGVEVKIDTSPLITLRNYVRVHLAADPLPRFDKRWLYGDFHYHSMGTDNEGEAAYNYRGVIRAMGSMGLDFLFATDHASSSEQLIDVDLPPISQIPSIAHDHGNKLLESDARITGGGLRDMDEHKYSFCHGLIYGTNGVNWEASLKAFSFRWPQNYLSHNVVPQIFLGGEVDAIPEAKISTVGSFSTGNLDNWRPNLMPYGNNLSFDLTRLLRPGHNQPYQLFEPVNDSYLIHDFQGVDSIEFYGREHLVYFPNSASLSVGSEISFVPSYTSKYGGATRRLQDLLPEFERKGVVFAAHHLNGSGSPGPDGIPWTTDHMLLQAFRSPAVLGLQFWNEDTRFRTRVCSHDYCHDNADGGSYGGTEIGYERNEKLEVSGFLNFLSLVIYGHEAIPNEFRNIALPLEEYRHGFLFPGKTAGGLFELQAFDVRNGLWQEQTFETENRLKHGAYDWDMMNLRGLDFENNASLTWLAPGEPRRMFMGGGSDAHGDLNYRRAGYFLGTDDANDTAIGKPRNLIFVGDPQGPVILHLDPVIAPESINPGSKPVHSQLARIKPPIVLPPDTPPIVKPPVIQPPVADPPIITPPIVVPPVIDPPVVLPPVEVPPIVIPPIVLPPEEPPATNKPPVIKPPIGGDVLGLDIRPHTQEQIIQALRKGRFCVTDGPAVRMAIDLNGNKTIDDGDIQMGEVYRLPKLLGPKQLNLNPGQTVTLLTECISTPEFGPINRIDVYVGVHPGPGEGEFKEPRMYAPLGHGPPGISDDAPPSPQVSYMSGGRTYVRLKDNYWNGDFMGDTLTALPSFGQPQPVYTYNLVTTLHLDHYEAIKGIPADRLFFRAFVQTSGNYLVDVPNRYAFTNPIWLLREHPVLDPGGTEPPSTPPQQPTIRVSQDSQGQLTVTFAGGKLQYTPRLEEPFQDLPSNTASPYTVPPGEKSGFFRCRWQAP